MKYLALTFLALASSGRPALPASQVFRVELSSRQVVKSLTLEAAGQSVKLCGEKSDGPCLVLPASKKIPCSADGRVHCRFEDAIRSFKFLTIDSTTPVQIAPTFAGMSNPPQAFVVQNARIGPSGGGLRITTQVDVESYVSGVIRGEASVLRTPAARQAMAILARTWALRRHGRHRALGFDFCSLTHCQVYRPPSATESLAGNGIDPAAIATRGQILQYRGKLVDPYFTASCGGMTEAAGSIWPDETRPYLIPVHDSYCLASTHASWSQTLGAGSLLPILRDSLHLPVTAPLTDLSVEKRDTSGRGTVLRVVAGGGAWDVDANAFRYAVDRRLGWQQIKSNLYSIRRENDRWVLSGHGLGHGVGLCQAGAEQMARLGSSTERILTKYFPGAEIAQEPALDADPIASCEHFELVYFSSQERWVRQTLDALEHWRKELGVHAEVCPQRVRVQTWTSVADFTRSTGEPGWAAAASDGQSITLQPLELLARKGILNQTLRHELTHLAVHRLKAKSTPQWFEEGMVLYLTGERIETPPNAFKSDGDLDAAIAHPHSQAEMKGAYAEALKRVRQFVKRNGEAAIWWELEHPTDTRPKAH